MAFDPDQYLASKAEGTGGSAGGFDPDAYLAAAAPSTPTSALRGVASGVTAGLDDELTGAVGAAGRLAGYTNLGAWKPFDPDSHLERTGAPLSRDEIANAYRTNRDAIRSEEAQDMATNPKATIAGNLAGAVMSPVGKLRAPQAMGPLTRMGTLAQGMKTAALQGAVFGAGSSNSDLTQGQVGQFAKDTAIGAGFGAAIPPVLEGAGYAAGKSAQAAKWGGTKLLSNLGGVKPATINEYAQFSDRINAAPSVEALKDISDEFVGKLASDVDAKKLTTEQAQSAFKGLQDDLKDAYKTAGYDARDAVTSAKQTLKDAHDSRIQQMSSDLYDTVNQLKDDVKSGSTAALKTLDNSNAKIDLAPTFAKIDGSISRLQKAGTDESLAVADKLQAYKARLMAKNWAVIAPQDAKKLIQGLDQITEYSPMAGTFDKAKNAAFKDVRASLDQTLKSSVPEYRTAMQPVAADTDLLGRVQGFGDRQSAAGLLQRINAPNQLDNRAALKALGEKYGVDYIHAAQPESLPEHALLTQAQGAQDALRSDLVSEKIDQTLAASRQKSALDTAQSGLESAKQTLAPFRSLAPNGAGQTQVQQKLEALAKGKNIELEGMFRELGKMTNTDFVQAMHDQGIQAAFKKGATNGSRNTLMGSVIGWMLGGIGGAAAGAGAGRVVDQWGPAITKRVLDASIRVSKSPTAQTIAGLDLPAPIKQKMLTGLEGYLAKAQVESGSALPRVASQGAPDRAPATGEARWAQSGLQKLGIQDQELAGRLMQDPKARQLLIQASDLAPGSRALKQIQDQIQKKWSQP